MTPAAGQPGNPYDVPLVRHRWMYVAGIVFWVLMVIFEIVVVTLNLRNNQPFHSSFWVGIAALIWMATMLIKAGRLRRSMPR